MARKSVQIEFRGQRIMPIARGMQMVTVSLAGKFSVRPAGIWTPVLMFTGIFCPRGMGIRRVVKLRNIFQMRGMRKITITVWTR
jgi:hypothetical protein